MTGIVQTPEGVAFFHRHMKRMAITVGIGFAFSFALIIYLVAAHT